MGLYLKLRGITESILQIAGTSGPQLKASGGAVEMRDAADAAYANARGADAVAADDLVTKRQLDAVIATTGLRAIRVPIALATVNSATSIPAGGRVFWSVLDVTTPYSIGTTITLGTPASPALFQAATDNNPLTANYWAVMQNVDAGGPTVVRATVAGAPAVGAADMLIFFDVPDS